MALHPANNQQNVMHAIKLLQEKRKQNDLQQEVKKHQGLAKQAVTKAAMHQKKSSSLEARVEELEKELDQLKTQFDPEYAWHKSDVKKSVSKTRRAQTKVVKSAKRKKTPATSAALVQGPTTKRRPS